MSFDQTTRTRLARFVGNTRSLLAEEFTRQLQNDYGLDPQTGDVTDLARLELDDARRETARLLRDTMEHYLATANTGTPAKAKKARQDVLDRIVREQAFTILNRLCALRMAEARGLLIESIAKGYQSKGFQLYQRLAGTALGEIGACYRLFIFSIFDEFAVDLPVLFDRFSPQGRLFPREAALLSVLQEINHPDIDPLWAEDETIGWIYQYFNDPNERKAMRDPKQGGSAAPRNSRELAVRNQFFTPRYVVEFLTDNTLGRIWYEMTKGESLLKDSCRYLVRRPNEIFLAAGEAAPAQEDTDEELTQEELLKQPVHILHRPLKDPRDIKMLDPACGSMHFGLYAFDLFERIYEEAWEIEVQRGADGFIRTEEHKPLHETYNDKDIFLRNVPRLIIERNIHGIDIDPRAVQIAGLSLWLRAQRSWQAQNVKALERPQIQRSNIVCAEPMPGEADMLEEFTEQLQPKVLGQLVKIIFEKMEFAGEAGSLLKIEEEIKEAIADAHKKYKDFIFQQKRDMEFLPGMAPKRESKHFEFVDLSKDEDFWHTAEQRVIDALRFYAERTDADSYQRRLFSNDTVRGFAFVDLCRKRFDAVVMNPPFGAFSKKHKKDAEKTYPRSGNDIYAAFVDRFLLKLSLDGYLGAITSRACFFTTSFIEWRNYVVRDTAHLVAMADLGEAVMDDAMVEAAAYILRRKSFPYPKPLTFWFREFSVPDREVGLLDSIHSAIRAKLKPLKSFFSSVSNFENLEGHPYVYWVGLDNLEKLSVLPKLEPTIGEVRKGLRTGDNFRFVRCLWEVPNCEISPNILPFADGGDRESSRFVPLVLSGSSQPWFSPLLVVLNWKSNGRELRTYVLKYGTESRLIQGKDFYFRPGISWTRRATRFVPYAVPAGCIPTGSRPMAFPMNCSAGLLLAITASNIASAFMRFYGEKFLWPNFLEGKVKLVPWPQITESQSSKLEKFVADEVRLRRLAYRHYEPFHEFLFAYLDLNKGANSNSLTFNPSDLLKEDNESLVRKGYGLSSEDSAMLCSDLFEALQIRYGTATSDGEDPDEGDSSDESVDSVINDSTEERARSLASYLLGTTLGRWDIRYATGELQPSELSDPFAPLPICPPGMLQNTDGLPADAKEVPTDYPLRISWVGILMDDEGHPEDIVTRTREAIEVIWKDRAEAIEQEVCEILGVKSLRDYFHHLAAFFTDHLKCYSKSRRQSPIYWPLSTPSGSHTLWLYYHRLTDQTLYTCVNDFVDPKLKQVSDDAAILRGKSNRSSAEEKELESLSDLELELKDFRDELLKIARFWEPNLNDGVQITAAPLWNLFQHRQWKARLKETWEKLEAGEYDWAHLALSIWPDRVVRASHKDRSYAIAHDLDDQLWHEVEVEKVGRGGRVTTTTEWQPRDLSSADLQRIIAEVKAR